MQFNIRNTVLSALMLAVFTACSLDKDPLSVYTEVILGSTDEDGDRIRFKNRGEILTQYENMYNLFRDRQEHWYLDYLLINEVRADNAYAGTTGAEVVPFENNSLNAGNSVLSRDWDRYMTDIGQATVIIETIDLVPDPAFSQSERAQWKAEAKIFRAMVMLEMARLWGNFPVNTKIPEDITSENITEVWPDYFPPVTSQKDAFGQILEDLTAAIPHAPNAGSDKTILTKAVARALLAKAYAEKSIQDYAKVIEYCNAVINDGFSLVDDYSMLFEMNEDGTDIRFRNTTESIFETHFYTGGGNWVSWMFGRDLLNWDSHFTWAKWVTPSRDLIAAFLAEGDDIRYRESIVYYETGWSNYYPSNNYPFMYKIRSANNSIIRIRLADILLLKAEALAHTGELDAAADIVDEIRARVNLNPLPSSVRGSQDQMISAVLHERRLELAFEGQRLFDLIRNNKLQEVMNTINQRDIGRLPQVRPYVEESELLPIPQTVLDANSNLEQNPGY